MKKHKFINLRHVFNQSESYLEVRVTPEKPNSYTTTSATEHGDETLCGEGEELGQSISNDDCDAHHRTGYCRCLHTK